MLYRKTGAVARLLAAMFLFIWGVATPKVITDSRIASGFYLLLGAFALYPLRFIYFAWQLNRLDAEEESIQVGMLTNSDNKFLKHIPPDTPRR